MLFVQKDVGVNQLKCQLMAMFQLFIRVCDAQNGTNNGHTNCATKINYQK